MILPKTYKAAVAAGYLVADRLVELTGLVPRRGEVPDLVKEKLFYRRSQLERCISLTDGRERGLRLREHAKPVGHRGFYFPRAGRISYEVYRLSDFEVRKPRVEYAAREMPLLEAIWIVNRAAKKQRDLASRCYHAAMHGLASHSRKMKDELYALKDRGVAFALSTKVLMWVGWHGNMSVVRGEGFCFHTRLRPKDVPEQSANAEFWKAEASDRHISRKFRLKDAIFTLESLEDRTGNFEILDLPWGRDRNTASDSLRGYYHDDLGDDQISDDLDMDDNRKDYALPAAHCARHGSTHRHATWRNL